MVEDLIRRARRRFLVNETLAQTAFGAAVFVGGFVLILIFGTRLLEWWTLTLFAAAGLAIALWRVLKRTPGTYETAIRLDENAKLHDALSTALYFSDHPQGSDRFRQSQRSQADTVAGEVHLEQAVPFVFPRSVYVMAALCVLASALIALRYGAAHGLNLRAPLTQLLFEDQSVQDAKKAKALYGKQKTWMDEAQSLLSKLGMKSNPDDPLPTDPDALDKAIDDALQGATNPGAQSQKGNNSAQGSKTGQAKSSDSQNEAGAGDPIDNPDEQANNDQSGQEGANPQAGQQGSKSTQGKNGSRSDKESLLSRLKEAVSNMLSNSNKQDSASQKSQDQAKNQTPNGEKGQAGKGAQEQGESQSDAEGQPDSSDGQNGQQAQGRLNNAQQNPSQGGSGIGNQDGSKEIKAAAQLKAMGKISEIIGQRAATVSGETSVEVQSGSQKLHTDYSNTSASHKETDSNVTRDEIPLSLQAYVQQYFEQVRKSGSAKQKAADKQ